MDLGGAGAILGATMVGVGTSSPSYPIHVSTIGSNNVSVFVAGDVLSLSDSNAKRDIRILDDGALDRLCKMSGYTYTHASVAGPCRSAGLLAQEVLEELPEAVRRDDGLLSVSYTGVLALVVEAIKDLRAEIEVVKRAVGL